jgi:RNA polymerase sigma factor (sigma-70 family)
VVENPRTRRFRALYDDYRARLIAYALRRTSSRDDAADVVAETYAIAWRRLDAVPEGDLALLWLFATARRVAANQRRQHRRSDDLVLRLGAELRGAFASVAPATDETAVTSAALLGRLSESDRELLILVGWDGLTTSELATVLGCSSTAARIRLHRARARLAAAQVEFEHGTKQGDPAGHLPRGQPVLTNDSEEA